MAGLLLKDIYNLRKYGKSIIFVLFCYSFLGFTMDSTFIVGLIGFFFAILILSTFSYDDTSKWDRYAAAMPVYRKQIVLAKYLLAFLLAVIGIGVGFVFSYVINFIQHVPFDSTILVVGYTVFLVILFYMSILFPLVYRFGVEKSRMLLMVIFLIPFLAIMGLSSMSTDLPAVSEVAVKTALYVAPLLIFVLYVISYFISCRIFQKKDL